MTIKRPNSLHKTNPTGYGKQAFKVCVCVCFFVWFFLEDKYKNYITALKISCLMLTKNWLNGCFFFFFFLFFPLIKPLVSSMNLSNNLISSWKSRLNHLNYLPSNYISSMHLPHHSCHSKTLAYQFLWTMNFKALSC